MKKYYLFLAALIFVILQGCKSHCCKECSQADLDSLIVLDSATATTYINNFIAADTNHVYGIGIPRCKLCAILQHVHTDSVWISCGMKPDSSFITIIKYLGSTEYRGINSSSTTTCPPGTRCK